MTDRFRRIRELTKRVLKVPDAVFLSENSKTGASINCAIALVCRPTKDCMKYCYGLEGRIRMCKALNRQQENVARFDHLATAPEEVVITEADRLARRMRLRRQNFLRFFGVGDMQPGSLRLINNLAEIAPDLKLWVSTRRFDLAAKIEPRDNVHVMLGTDKSTPATDVAKVRALIQRKNPNYFAAWVQQSADEKIPPWAKVVFAEHHLQHRADWSKNHADPRTCPATKLGGKAHDDACLKCGRCFTKER